MTEPADNISSSTEASSIARRAVLYPNHYCWLVLFSALDIMLTHTILQGYLEYNGREVNTFADFVIRHTGMNGAIALKTVSIVTVIFICEYVGRRRPATGQTLANAIVGLSTVPVIIALAQLAGVALGLIQPVQPSSPRSSNPQAFGVLFLDIPSSSPTTLAA